MITLAQRSHELRTQREGAGLAFPQLWAFLRTPLRSLKRAAKHPTRSSRRSWPPTLACPYFTSGERATTVPVKKAG